MNSKGIESDGNKYYAAPELIEHGSIEEITGYDDSEYGCSGKTHKPIA